MNFPSCLDEAYIGNLTTFLKKKQQLSDKNFIPQIQIEKTPRYMVQKPPYDQILKAGKPALRLSGCENLFQNVILNIATRNAEYRQYR
jgi:hypothetical protein